MQTTCAEPALINTAVPNRIEVDGVAYRLKPMARGGCAVAYIGAAEGAGRAPLLFKIPHRHVLARDSGLRQWQNECSLLSTLRHPAIPRPIAIRNAPYAYMAYPFIAGANLQQYPQARLRSRRMDETIVVGVSLLRILGYLHRRPKPVAHGDVRPHNVLVDSHRQIRLIDFGCAQEAGGRHYSPWVAAPRYLSPEQARGAQWGLRSDLYQVGLLLYELLTGATYNAAPDARAAMLRAARPAGFPIQAVQRLAGRGFACWLSDLLDPDPASRMPSADCAVKLLLALTARHSPGC